MRHFQKIWQNWQSVDWLSVENNCILIHWFKGLIIWNNFCRPLSTSTYQKTKFRKSFLSLLSPSEFLRGEKTKLRLIVLSKSREKKGKIMSTESICGIYSQMIKYETLFEGVLGQKFLWRKFIYSLLLWSSFEPESLIL